MIIISLLLHLVTWTHFHWCAYILTVVPLLSVIVLLPVPYGTIIFMLRIRMQSGRDLGKHPKTKASQILNEEYPNISIAHSQQDHPPNILQMRLVLLEDF